MDKPSEGNKSLEKVYSFNKLSDTLLYIRWNSTPNVLEGQQFLVELESLIARLMQPTYIISDLRRGTIRDVPIIQKLAQLSRSPLIAGTTAFSGHPVSSMFVDIYERFARRRKPEGEIWNTPEDALAYLESLEPGVTAGIDWLKVLQLPDEAADQ